MSREGAGPPFTAAQGFALALAFLVGLALGFASRAVLFAPAPPPPFSGSGLVSADPRTLVVQPQDVPSSYTIHPDLAAAEPGQTHPRSRYSVTISKSDSSHYLGQCAVAIYDTAATARAALQKLLQLGQFGSELQLLGPLGEEGHLYAAKDDKRGVVVGSALWRYRNVVAYVFVYNPYQQSTPADEVDRLARGNAYDNTMSLAARIADHIKQTG